jgi:hypothetical protein
MAEYKGTSQGLELVSYRMPFSFKQQQEGQAKTHSMQCKTRKKQHRPEPIPESLTM